MEVSFSPRSVQANWSLDDKCRVMKTPFMQMPIPPCAGVKKRFQTGPTRGQCLSEEIDGPNEVVTFARQQSVKPRDVLTARLASLLQSELIPKHWGINE